MRKVINWVLHWHNEGLPIDAKAAQEGYTAEHNATAPYSADYEPTKHLSWLAGKLTRDQERHEEAKG